MSSTTWKSSPSSPANARHADAPAPEARRPSTPHIDGRREERAGFQPVELGEVVAALEVELLAADHPERRLDELARDVRRS